jgi:raffinose/stachyose/melibiose transport system permease protein
MRKVGGQRIVAYLILIVATVLSVLPTIYMIDLSFRNPVDSFSPVLFSPNPTMQNYQTIFANSGFVQYFVNSLVVSVLTVMLTLFFVILATFGLSRLKIRGRNIIFYVIISGLMIPLASLIVPLTVVLKSGELLNNYFGLIGPFTAIGTPFGLLVMKGAMDNFPRELEEAAVVEGASRLRVLWKIIVPTTIPSLLVVAIWQFLYSWNEFFLSLVVMTDPAMKTVPLLPLQFEGPYMTNPGALFAVLTVISLVPMLVYIVLQKWFVGGLMAGGIKG